MEENKKTKNIKLTLYIIGILCLMVGVSYATYNLVLKGNKEHQVNIGSLTLKYEETNNINVTGDTLKTDEEGIASTNSFNFKVSVNNTTSKDVNYIVYLTMDEEYKANAKVGKVYLNNKTKNITYGPSFITDLSKYKYTNSYVLCTNTFTSTTETHEYELKSWISATEARNETDDTHETFLGGAVKFKVSVETTGTPATETLMALTNNSNSSGLYTITHAADSTLQIGATESITEYRYRGANPKNYVTFNNEVWRIIGVFPTDDGTGKIENRIKLIRNESIGDKFWDGSVSNNWARPATLNTELNTTYLNSLTSEAQNMIGNTKYYLGGKHLYDNGYADTPLQFYSYERKIKNTKENEFYYGTIPNSWVGKVALMYVSDYGYASSNCENKRIYESNSSSNDISACNGTNWLFNNDFQWLLPQDPGDSSNAFDVRSDGRVYGGTVSLGQFGARPVLYLTSFTQITGGNGTSTSPYTLGL